MVKHAFLIVAHRYPEQLFDILQLLKSNNHYFFINLDTKLKDYNKVIKKIKDEIPNTHFECKEVSHGGYSQIECTLNLLKISYKGEIDYFHLISGQDFPCRSNFEFDHFFKENLGKSFMHYDSEDQHNMWVATKYQNRVRPWYFNDIKHRNIKIIDLIVKSLNVISSKIKLRPPIKEIRAGWNWFSWHRNVVKFVLEQYETNKDYFNRFKHTSCCDEVIFHTLLYNNLKELDIEPYNSLRYINWNKEVPNRRIKRSPLILNEEEYNDIVVSNTFFCRKIDPQISLTLKKLLVNRIKPGYQLTDKIAFE